MLQKEKSKIIQKLNESQLRKDVIIPLLSRMGFYFPVENHGTLERGKDILTFELDKLGNRRFLAVVAKTGDLTGDVSSNRSLREVIFQVKQCFDITYKNLFDMREINIDNVWIITSGKIKSGSEEAIFDSLRKENLNKLIKIISIEQLIGLIDQYYDSYWSSGNETKEQLLLQRERLLDFIDNLLQKYGADGETIRNIKSHILNSKYEPRIRNDYYTYLTAADNYSIDISKISGIYKDLPYSTQCEFILPQYKKAKEDLYYSMFEIEEILDNYNKVIKEENPNDFVDSFYKNLDGEYPFGRRTAYGRPQDAEKSIIDLVQGINDINSFAECLKQEGKYEWATEIFLSIKKLEETIHELYKHCENVRLKILFNVNREGKVDIVANDKNEYDFFVEEYIAKCDEVEDYFIRDYGSFLSYVYYHARKYIEDIIDYEKFIRFSE